MPAEVESMMYVAREGTPWHGLGTALDHVPTAREAIVAAGLDWTVELKPVYVEGRMVPDHKAIVRSTDHQIFGFCGKVYTPIQNRDSFNFFDAIVGEGLAVYHTAGSLFNGKKIWILAKLPNSFSIAGEEIQGYICLTTSHDGSTPFNMFNTEIRVVCANTLKMAVSKALNHFYARHTTNFASRLDAARETLGLLAQESAAWRLQAQYLATHQLPAGKIPLLLAASFGTTGAIKTADVVDFDTISTAKKNQMAVVSHLIEHGRGQDNPKIRGTKWQAFNAVAEYTDYYKKSRKNSDDRRLDSAWFGGGALIKARAWEYLIKE
jgi:phage/plasmid-like protein (TIGR03299 family)